MDEDCFPIGSSLLNGECLDDSSVSSQPCLTAGCLFHPIYILTNSLATIYSIGSGHSTGASDDKSVGLWPVKSYNLRHIPF